MLSRQANLPGKQYQFISKATSEDTFWVVNFKGSEGISQLYEYEITLMSHDPEIDLKKVLKNPAVFIMFRDGEPRMVHGILAQFEQLHEVDDHIFYKALLVPRLWQADLYHENQLFIKKTVPDVIKEILAQTGLQSMDYEFIQTREYAKWEYICQFRETDFNFISRWMEREGLYYFFEQNDGFDKLIITDHLARHNPIPEKETYVYSPPSGLALPEGEIISNLACRYKNLPKQVILKDYNYRKSAIELKSQASVDPKGRGMIYLYGEHFKTRAEGKVLATIKAEELLCREQVFYGESTSPTFNPGFYMNIRSHYRQDYNQKYLITEVVHKGSQASFLLTGLSKGSFNEPEEFSDMVYSNHFTAIPAMNNGKNLQFRPEKIAKKTRFYGTMNAKVDASGDGQYAEIDEYGRYKVILPFDLSGKSGGKASRFVRMAQPYAGADYGMHFPLHKNVEVLLSFVDGDPDRPIISSAIPNVENASPVSTNNQAQSMIRSAGGNELHFDDTQKSENIYLHGTHDWTIDIAHDKNQTIGNNESIYVGVNKSINIGNDKDQTIGNNESLTVQHSRKKDIFVDETISIGNDKQQTIGNNEIFVVQNSRKKNIGKDEIIEVGNDKNQIIGNNESLTIHNNRQKLIKTNEMEQIGAVKQIKIGDKLEFQCGSAQLSVESSGKISIAGTEFSIDCGAGKLVINKSGVVSIVGTKFEVQSDGPAVIKGSTIHLN